jgi:hypothetical protein
MGAAIVLIGALACAYLVTWSLSIALAKLTEV